MKDRFVLPFTKDEGSPNFKGLSYGFLRTNRFYANDVINHIFNKQGYYYVLCIDGDGWGKSKIWVEMDFEKISELWHGLYKVLPHKDSCIAYADEILIIDEEDISEVVKDYFNSVGFSVTINVYRFEEAKDYNTEIIANSLKNIRRYKEEYGRGEIYHVE